MPADSPEAQAQAQAPDLDSAEANRRFYATHAAVYDETEFCAIEEAPREALHGVLERALALVPAERPLALDAGGGTGNASLMLFEMGHEPVLLDTSPEMIARYERKAEALGLDPRTEVGDLEAFFASDDRSWDLDRVLFGPAPP